MRHRLAAVILLAAVGTTSAARAAEIISYSYDAKGRLVKVERSGSVNNGIIASYTLDKADNRIRIRVTNSPNSTPPP